MKKLAEGKIIGLDTMVFIYHLEDFAGLSATTEHIFTRIESGKNPAVTSSITLLEILVKPKREGKVKIVSDYRDLLLTFPNLQFLPLDLAVADRASTLRAKYGLRTPDAIQIATAITAGAAVFITNDEALRKVDEIPVVMLGDLAR